MSRSRTPLLTIGEVADRVGCSPKTVTRWIAAGDLIAVKLGKLVRVSEDELSNYLNRRRTV